MTLLVGIGVVPLNDESPLSIHLSMHVRVKTVRSLCGVGQPHQNNIATADSELVARKMENDPILPANREASL
jgi:hypothetical protein